MASVDGDRQGDVSTQRHGGRDELQSTQDGYARAFHSFVGRSREIPPFENSRSGEEFYCIICLFITQDRVTTGATYFAHTSPVSRSGLLVQVALIDYMQ